MFAKGNIVYSDAYKYLRYKSAVSFKFNDTNIDKESLEEKVLNLDNLSVTKDGIRLGAYFIVKPENMTYAAIKTAVIKMRYSNDDQMALILNKDNSEEDTMLYEKMQEWREFASEVAKKTVINFKS